MPKVKELLQKVPFSRFIGDDQAEIDQLLQLDSQLITRYNLFDG